MEALFLLDGRLVPSRLKLRSFLMGVSSFLMEAFLMEVSLSKPFKAIVTTFLLDGAFLLDGGFLLDGLSFLMEGWFLLDGSLLDGSIFIEAVQGYCDNFHS